MQTVSRLIKYFVPDNYELSISLNRSDKTFVGTVTISGELQADSQQIVLHSKDLDIRTVLIDGKGYSHSQNNDELTISCESLNPGKHLAVIGFSGKITDAMHGLYPCYFEHDGQKKELLATQFESHHAREVFPCIDEPEAKATFDLTLQTEQQVVVLGNMPISSQKVENDNLVTKFKTTPRMSTYLLAWVVGDLHKKTSHTKSGIEVNVWATPAQSSDSLNFALDIATRTIDFYDEYFDTPYPLPKCDHVALPDFSSGAMENWGLITYREVALLADPKNTSVLSKRYIATVITHELSHQWFGNLVTMAWWNDLWLNESFASLVEYTALNALEPEWNVWLDFASYDCIAALKRDSIDGVQPVRIDVNHPDEISTLFDGAIVYAKGARLLQMLENYIGEDTFRSGLKKYFKTFAYKNTVAEDLWGVLSEASGKNISEFMNTWLEKPGFPVVHITKDANKLILDQNRLTTDGSIISDSIWPITLNSNCSKIPQIFDKKHLEISGFECDKNLRLNVGNYAHFITHYDNFSLKNILKEIESGSLSPIDRLQILNEQNILASCGIISNAKIIPILGAYSNETEDSVWDIIGMSIGELKKFVEKDEVSEKKLRALAGKLAAYQYNRLGLTRINDEPEEDTKLRSTIVGLMMYSENDKARAEAANIFQTTELEKIDSDTRASIISSYVRNYQDEKTIDNLINVYKTTVSSDLKQDVCLGLTSTKSEDTINRLLGLIKNPEIVRIQDVSRWIAYLARNKYARAKTWQWVKDNWSWIEDVFGGDKSYDEFPRYIASSLKTRNELGDYVKFFEPMLSEPSLQRIIKIGINEITSRVDTIEKDGEKVRQALLNL